MMKEHLPIPMTSRRRAEQNTSPLEGNEFRLMVDQSVIRAFENVIREQGLNRAKVVRRLPHDQLLKAVPKRQATARRAVIKVLEEEKRPVTIEEIFRVLRFSLTEDRNPFREKVRKLLA